MEYDDINNKQREVVYSQRDLVLKNENLKELIIAMMKETVEDLIEGSLSGETRADWNYEYLSDKLEEIYDYSIPELYLDMEKGKIREETFQDLLDRYNNKERELGTEQFRGIERYIMLEVLDQRWRENLKNLTELREGIYLRSYGQKNPVNEYKIIDNVWNFKVGRNHSSKDKVAFKHPAIFPEQLANDHIISWSNEGDIVYDPFMGSGTTAKMAILNNRNWIGSEISKEYCEIAEKRINENL